MNLFVIFILFQNIIMKIFPDTPLSYWDEILFLVVFFAFVLKCNCSLKLNDVKFLGYVISLVFIGILGDVIFRYQENIFVIVRDIIGTVKFPLTFIALYKLKFMDKLTLKAYNTISFIKCVVLLCFICGIISMFVNIGMSQDEIRMGIHPFMFLYSHPTYLTTSMICILCLLNAVENLNYFWEFIIIANIILGMRTKGLLFIAIYIFVKYILRLIKAAKIIYIMCIVLIVIGVLYDKVMLYMSFSNSPRESLYFGAIQLVIQCIPFGAGFGTYASFVSTNPLSQVYQFIYIDGLYDAYGNITPDVGDAGLAYYIGQFGILGIIMCIIIVNNMVKISIKGIEKSKRISIYMMWIMFAISIPFEAILVNNGFELAFIIVLVSKICKLKSEENIGHKIS